ncbi:MAG: DUF4383 domain-containing protein [Rubrobacter sp.]|nr:DUF4383 domain-containing protein [Rubrobacter sp.]
MRRDTPKTVALIIGIAFLAVGLLGLILNPTGGNLLGTFAVDLLHNLIHLVVGVAGLAVWFLGLVESRIFLKVLGVVYIILGIVGFIPPLFDNYGHLLGIVRINNADNILHLVVGALAAYFGFSPQYRPGAASRIMGRG